MGFVLVRESMGVKAPPRAGAKLLLAGALALQLVDRRPEGCARGRAAGRGLSLVLLGFLEFATGASLALGLGNLPVSAKAGICRAFPNMNEKSRIPGSRKMAAVVVAGNDRAPLAARGPDVA
jgi:hypothetical protein